MIKNNTRRVDLEPENKEEKKKSKSSENIDDVQNKILFLSLFERIKNEL